MVGPLFDMFTAEPFISFDGLAHPLCQKCPNTEFFLVHIFLYSARIQKNTDQKNLRIWTFSMQWPGLTFYGSGPARLPSWLGMMNARWFGSMQSETVLQMKFIIFPGCPTKQAAFLLEQPAPYNQLLIQAVLLVPECYSA